MRFVALLAAGAAGLCVTSPSFAADPSLIADAKAFGTRQSVESVDISPSGKRILMVDPGPGKSSILTWFCGLDNLASSMSRRAR